MPVVRRQHVAVVTRVYVHSYNWASGNLEWNASGNLEWNASGNVELNASGYSRVVLEWKASGNLEWNARGNSRVD